MVIILQADCFWDLQKNADLKKVVCKYRRDKTVGDLKTLRAEVSDEDKRMTKSHSNNYKEGWLNDKVIRRLVTDLVNKVKPLNWLPSIKKRKIYPEKQILIQHINCDKWTVLFGPKVPCNGNLNWFFCFGSHILHYSID